MIRYLRYLFIAVIGIGLITLALANREPVTLRALPADVESLTGYNFSYTLPLYLILFGHIVLGLVIGFIWEWFREHKHRAAAAANRREREKLAREVDKLKRASPGSKDEVLALVEGAPASR